MSETGYGNFEDLLAIADDIVKELVSALRAEILKIDQNAFEVIRLGDRAATYGIGPKKMSEGYCYIMPHKSWVNLGFYQGASLSDPNTLLEGTGKNMRHVKIRSLDDSSNPKVKALIQAALLERQSNFSV